MQKVAFIESIISKTPPSSKKEPKKDKGDILSDKSFEVVLKKTLKHKENPKLTQEKRKTIKTQQDKKDTKDIKSTGSYATVIENKQIKIEVAKNSKDKSKKFLNTENLKQVKISKNTTIVAIKTHITTNKDPEKTKDSSKNIKKNIKTVNLEEIKKHSEVNTNRSQIKVQKIENKSVDKNNEKPLKEKDVKIKSAISEITVSHANKKTENKEIAINNQTTNHKPIKTVKNKEPIHLSKETQASEISKEDKKIGTNIATEVKKIKTHNSIKQKTISSITKKNYNPSKKIIENKEQPKKTENINANKIKPEPSEINTQKQDQKTKITFSDIQIHKSDNQLNIQLHKKENPKQSEISKTNIKTQQTSIKKTLPDKAEIKNNNLEEKTTYKKDTKDSLEHQKNTTEAKSPEVFIKETDSHQFNQNSSNSYKNNTLKNSKQLKEKKVDKKQDLKEIKQQKIEQPYIQHSDKEKIVFTQTSTLQNNSNQNINQQNMPYPMDKVIEHIDKLINLKPPVNRSLTIQLSPPHLGSLNLKVSIDRAKNIVASITVHDKDTYKTITHHIDNLKEYLIQQGLKVNSVDVHNSFNENLTNQFFSSTNQQFSQQQQHTGNGSVFNFEEFESHTQQSQQKPNIRQQKTGLDITV